MTEPTAAELARKLDAALKRSTYEQAGEWLHAWADELRSALSRLAQVEREIAELKSCLASWQKSAGPNSERVGQQEREITRLNNGLSAMTERWRAAELECANVVVRLAQVERERDASDALVAREWRGRFINLPTAVQVQSVVDAIARNDASLAAERHRTRHKGERA